MIAIGKDRQADSEGALFVWSTFFIYGRNIFNADLKVFIFVLMIDKRGF